jgi:ubiquinone/menaquinone biosynthesis C-methylase UbiE
LLALDALTAVLDLAAGTGKLARLLVPHVGRLWAVDPSESMLEKLRSQLPGVEGTHVRRVRGARYLLELGSQPA